MTMADGRVTGFFHAGVTVRDMGEALRFYRDTLGLEVVSEGRGSAPHQGRILGEQPGELIAVFLRVPGSDALVELFEFVGMERHGASARPWDFGAGHFCLYVDDTDAMFERLTAAGYRTRGGEVVTIASGPHQGAKVVYAIDPNGYHVELYQRAPQ
jgi:lactoylglutathione lyase